MKTNADRTDTGTGNVRCRYCGRGMTSGPLARDPGEAARVRCPKCGSGLDAARNGESLQKTHQCAQLLAADVLEAHRLACERGSGALTIVLRDLLAQVVAVEQRLDELAAVESSPHA